jgi:hypothetical protein
MNLKEMSPKNTPKRLNRVLESRFGFAIDFDHLTYGKALRLKKELSEGLAQIRKSHGVHVSERNPKYTELMLVKEGLDHWLKSERGLFEGEMGRSETVLAAKDMVDSMQDMLEKVSRMQNEEMPSLIDTIRDQIGSQEADGFKAVVAPLLANLYQALTGGRDEVDTAVRALAGEQVEQPMDMGGSGKETSFDQSGQPAALGQSGRMPQSSGMSQGLERAAQSGGGEEGGDEFNATDAAAGGNRELGRRRR